MSAVVSKAIDPARVDWSRFWSKVGYSDGCWEWRAAKTSHGYGVFSVAGRLHGAHRVAYAIANWADPGPLDVLHRCDNTACVRPAHLFIGTARDNGRDMIAKARGRMQFEAGHRRSVTRLNPEAVRTIRFVARCGASASEIGWMYGVSKGTIVDLLSGDTWSHVR